MIKKHHLKCDVFIAGGGIAGVCCALAAARNGVRTILCHNRPVLGGNASSEVRMHICGAASHGRHERGEALVTEPREGGILEEIRLLNAVHNPQRSASVADLILYDLCRREKNLQLFLNTSVECVETRWNRILTVSADRSNTEDRFRFEAEIFIDCTGDGRLGMEAGAPFREGRESREMFDESLAQPIADKRRLGSTIMIQTEEMPYPVPFVAPPWIRKFTRKDLALRLYAVCGEEKQEIDFGYWWVECGGTLDTIADDETIRDELLATILGVWDHIKNGDSDFPGIANRALSWIGFVSGKRESRRFIGQTTLTQNDLLGAKTFPDAIAYGGWPLDMHPPEGIECTETEPCQQHSVPYLYEISASATISREIENLMFAGRNISATHVAFSSTRVMGTCAVVGQGVGTVAAFAIRHGISPNKLYEYPDVLNAIRQQLLKDDAFLIGLRNEDPLDLARTAKIVASGEQAGSGAENIRSGYTRSVYGERGARPDRCEPGTQRWMSPPIDGDPPWIELSWETPFRLKSVQLVFDTGMHRHLTLTHREVYAKTMHWGQPQEETVRDYRIEGKTGDDWKTLLQVDGNFLRSRRHEFEVSPLVSALRVVVTGTNGIDHARIFEIRAYADGP